jgi:amino acid transporter/nucleotide-binding universal stress UspA family protein
MGPSLDVNRPRNVDWTRAAALLYGDWGTSKAYVIGLAFVAAGFAALPVIIAVCVLTAIVGYNYSIVCRNFPDGGGVYSAARQSSRLLAAVGALLLIANFLVTAALSGWSAMSYFGVPEKWIPYATMGTIICLGAVNWFGPKHSGTMSIAMAIPTVIVVVLLVGMAIPFLSVESLRWPSHALADPAFLAAHPHAVHGPIAQTWVWFTGAILALSGVEAVASMTGVMKLDPGSDPEKPRVGKTAGMALFVVAIEVIVATVILGWAMLSLKDTPENTAHIAEHKDYMLRFLGGHFGTELWGAAAGKWIAWTVGIVFGVLLLSAVNTAINAVVGVFYMLAQDGEMPRSLTRLNGHGVPVFPLALGALLPVLILAFTSNLEALAELYEISVVGAIAVNLGACFTNRKLDMRLFERVLMGVTFFVLLGAELTIAYTKPTALFFAVVVIGGGLGLRAYSHKLTGIKTLTVAKEVADLVTPEAIERLRPQLKEGQKIMVAARGPTPVLRFALDEAKLRNASLCVLYVKEIAVFFGASQDSSVRKKQRWQDDPQAAPVMSLALKLGEETGVPVQPVYAVSADPAATILDLAATLGADYLMLGSPHRSAMARLLKGNVVERVASELPENIQLIIHS